MNNNMVKPQKSRPPEVIKLNDAAKLAAQLMSKMTNSEWKITADDNESTVVEPNLRPPRLGLGAKVTRQFRDGPSSNDPLDRKLYNKLDAGKKQAARKMSEDTTVLNNEDDDDDDDDDEESKTAIFDKKRVATRVTMPPFQVKKNRR